MSKASGIPPSPNPIRKRWAFLVGINRYNDPQYPNLNFCVADVQAVDDLLKQVGYEVKRLDDGQSGALAPTKDNILAELTTFCKSHPDDLLLVYFACHGLRIQEKPYLIAQNTRASMVEKQAIPLQEIEDLLRGSDARRKILLLDACHTGIEMGRDITDPEFIRHVYDQAEGFALLAASTAQQRAFEIGSAQHGVFSYFVLQGLAGQADRKNKNFVTVDDLRGHVLHGIRDWSKSEGGLVQEPTARCEGIGDFILVDYREQPRPTLSVDPLKAGSADRSERASLDSISPNAVPGVTRNPNQQRIKSLESQLELLTEQLSGQEQAKILAPWESKIRIDQQIRLIRQEIETVESQLMQLRERGAPSLETRNNMPSSSPSSSAPNQSMITALLNQHRTTQERFEAVVEALEGASADEEIKLEARRDSLARKLAKIKQQLKGLGHE